MSEPWWKSAVVYQIYPRSFADTNGDGIGDLPGIIERLDYLATLGVDAIWLSPVYRSPQDDNGYDISDYEDIDPVFGTLADMDRLISAAHDRGIRVVMDLVVNHTSDEHPWFQESRSSIDNPKRDWYWWRPARPGTVPGEPGAEPNNWGSFFSQSAWTFDETTREYFLHLFSRRQPDLNWENPNVRQAIYAMMRWWLDRGIDGFRMDVINLISKDPSLPDGASNGPFGDGSASYMNGPRIHEFLKEMHREVFAGREDDLLTVGETPGATVDEARRYTDPAEHEMDMLFQFEHMTVDVSGNRFSLVPLDLPRLKAVLQRWQDGLAEVGWNSLYWNNHDQVRVVSRFGDDGEYRVPSAKLLGTVLHMMRGTPYIYQGEELGMTNLPFGSIDDFRDIESINFYAAAVARGEDPEMTLAGLRRGSRDNARSPMQWDASPTAGFTTGKPWLPVNPNAVEINAAAEMNDRDSVFTHYQRLVALRHELRVVAYGDFTMLLPDDPAIFGYTRHLDGDTLLVVANFSDAPNDVMLDDAEAWATADLVLGNYAEPPTAARGLSLRPWEARILRRRTGSGTDA